MLILYYFSFFISSFYVQKNYLGFNGSIFFLNFVLLNVFFFTNYKVTLVLVIHNEGHQLAVAKWYQYFSANFSFLNWLVRYKTNAN